MKENNKLYACIFFQAKSRIEHALYNKEYANFIDSKLQANYVETELKIMIACAAACLYKPSYFRPQMRQVKILLHYLLHILPFFCYYFSIEAFKICKYVFMEVSLIGYFL